MTLKQQVFDPSQALKSNDQAGVNQKHPARRIKLGIHIPEVGRFFRFAFHRGDSSLGNRLSGPMA